jgi:acyl carrier protein
MKTNESLEAELKEMIIDVVALEDIVPEDIESDAALFVEGLGLDSIDALEIAMALEERYGVATDTDADADEYREHFASIRSLAAFVAENRTK